MKKTIILVLSTGLMSTSLSFGQTQVSGQQVQQPSKLKTEICLSVSAILPANTQVVTISPASATGQSSVSQTPTEQILDDSSYQLKRIGETKTIKTKVSSEDISSNLQ